MTPRLRRARARYRSRSVPPAPAIARALPWLKADRAIDDAVGALEIVRRHHDDRARWREAIAAAPTSSADDSSSRPVNGSSSSTSRGACTSARSSASRWRKPAREPGHAIVRAIGQARRRQRLVDARLDGRHAVQPSEELQVFARREVAVEKQIVAEHADPAAQRVARVTGRAPAVAHVPARRPHERREHAEQRRLAGAVRTEQADDFSRRDRAGDVRQRAAPPVVARDVADLDAIEIPPGIGRHARAHATRRREAGPNAAQSPAERIRPESVSAR